jgi:pimeloyl-ACP methyl ester carboxylesterase
MSLKENPQHVVSEGARLAYHATPGRGPTVVFLTGFRSDMTGSKALALEAYCATLGQAFVRFDYRGHGASDGRFEDGTIGAWRNDTLAILDQVVEGPAVLVGSSMGGWIMLLAALARPERVVGLVGIAAAPDFTRELMEHRASPGMLAALERDRVWHEPSPYADEPTPITRHLLDEGRHHLLLDADIAIGCPVHLLHGQRDPDVPWQTSLRLAERLESDSVIVELIKDGEHRLSRQRDLARLRAALDRVLTEAG